MFAKNFLLGCRSNGFFYTFRFTFLIRFINFFALETDELLSKNFRNIKILKKSKNTIFNVKPTKDKLANRIYKKLIGKHTVKGQFLLEITDCFLLTQWSIPVTKQGKVIVEPSGHIGMLVTNILNSSDSGFLPEIRLIFFLTLIKVSYHLQINFFRNVDSYKSLFHMVPRHGFKPLEPAISHWIFENLPQLTMYNKAISKNKNCKLFIGENLYDWQDLTLNLMGIKKSQIFKIKKNYLSKVKYLYISRLPYVHSNRFMFQPEERKWVNKTMRNSLEKKYNCKNIPGKKLAISRKFCGRRRLINEDKALEILKKAGYEIIYPEKLYEIDKVIKCYESDTILNFPSGSNVANIIFSNRGRLIDILGKNKESFISIWFLVSRELEMEYRVFLAKDIKLNNDYRCNDLEIDTKELNLFKEKIE